MRQRIRRSLALVAIAAAGSAGCQRARNYLDPTGPVYRHAAAASLPAPDAAAPFRVVSFNIAHALEVERGIEALTRSVRLARPDVLALQEMDAPAVARIAGALQLNAVYFPSGVHPKHRKDFGCAVLSPWPLVEERKLVLPHGARVSGLRRAAASAIVTRGSLRVRVYSVHLPSPIGVSGRSRRDQVRALLRDAAREDAAVVVAGDFNAHDVGGELVAAGYAWPTRDAGPSTLDGHSYDHIFVRGLAVSASGVEPDNKSASDHRPVWAELIAPPRAQGPAPPAVIRPH